MLNGVEIHVTKQSVGRQFNFSGINIKSLEKPVEFIIEFFAV